jgi:hypothetical protein
VRPLTLRKQLQRPGKECSAALAPLKIDSQRDVVLLPQLAGLLREQRAQSQHAREEDFVFTLATVHPSTTAR